MGNVISGFELIVTALSLEQRTLRLLLPSGV